jgi:tetratricopeptide (TPR) repeat protein
MSVKLADVQELRLHGRHQEAYVAASQLLRSPQITLTAEALVRNELGLLLKAAGAYQQAREQYQRALHQLLAQPGAGDSDEAATLLHNLAGIRFVLGDPAGAARCARRGLEMRRRLSGPDDLAVLLDEGNLSPVLIALGDYDAAQQMLDRLLAEFTRRLGSTDAEVAVTLGNLGALAAHTQDWPKARDHLARAAAIKQLRFGADSPELISTLANLAVVMHRQGDRVAARRVLGRTRRIARLTLSASHPLRHHVERLRSAAPAAPEEPEGDGQ